MANWNTELIYQMDMTTGYRLCCCALEIRGLDKALAALTPTEAEVIYHRFQEKMTLEQVTSLTGKTRKQVRQSEHKALRRIRKSLLEDLNSQRSG